jgi:uncharacterized repeat protein (TIGR03803 family)
MTLLTGNSFAKVALRCAFRLALMAALWPQIAIGQTLTTLHNFSGSPDGAYPTEVALVADSQGNLYGATENGGNPACFGGVGCGIVFKVTPDGTETVLHNFAVPPDGYAPQGSLTADSHGNLYGTTLDGGTNNSGTVFKLSPDGTETVLYSFGLAPDGREPSGGVIMDGQQNFYGTTIFGGASGNGTVFKLTSAGIETVLYSFKGGVDGKLPTEKLTLDSEGNLYGTTSSGGAHNRGIVFKITPDGSETVLFSFGHGKKPSSQLIFDSKGNLYGTTGLAGAHHSGMVFRLSPSGKLKVLHNFAAAPTDGSQPTGLLMDQAGNFYGSTSWGGVSNCGAIYKLSPTGTETLLYSFPCSGGESSVPLGGLIMDNQGNLYGTTLYGPSGLGSVFKLTP